YIEGRFKHKEGHYVWLECTFKPYKDEKKEPKFLVVARDITEKKQSALKIKESEDKYKNILENIKEGYFEVDLEGNFTHVNPSFCYILGYSAKELYSRNSSEFTNRSIKKRIRNFFTKIYITELPRSNFVSPFIKKDNEMIFLEFSAYLRFNSEGNKIGFCGLIRDITDKIKAEQMIKEEVIKLKKLDYLKNEFVGRASH
ncbi:MAG: PAS domain-containing protein, partial [Candidatus Hermodarchaeota archaeon]